LFQGFDALPASFKRFLYQLTSNENQFRIVKVNTIRPDITHVELNHLLTALKSSNIVVHALHLQGCPKLAFNQANKILFYQVLQSNPNIFHVNLGENECFVAPTALAELVHAVSSSNVSSIYLESNAIRLNKASMTIFRVLKSVLYDKANHQKEKGIMTKYIMSLISHANRR